MPIVTPEGLDRRHLLDAINEGVCILDGDERLVWVNSRFAQMVGHEREDVVGKTLEDFLRARDRERFQAWAGERRGSSDPFELVLVRRDGSNLPVLVSPRPRFEQGGVFSGSIAVITDTTLLKRAEEDLRRSEATWRALLDATTDDAYLMETSGVVLACNESAASALGVTREEVIGRNVLDFFSEEVAARRRAVIEKAARSGKPFEFEDERGGRRHHAVVFPIPGVERVTRIAVYTRDVTEARRTEEEAMRAQKLESLGVLAGGIAHDFNNLLTAIQGNISLATMAVAEGEDASEALDEASRAASRATELAQQLLAFARGGSPVLKPVDPRQLVTNAQRFLPPGASASLTVVCRSDLSRIDGDERQLRQVVEQLVRNATEAMPGGGVIRILAQDVVVSEGGFQGMASVGPGRYVKIEVTDQGVGIREGDLERIFDPYFSTKGKDSGLGLSITYNVVTRHGGYIAARNLPEGGACFTILLPASSGSGRATARGRPGQVTRSLRVLVMDDESIVRKFLMKVLARSGHETSEASDGQEALDAYRAAMEAGRPFDVVIMDLTVPRGMGGDAAIARLLEMDPAARAVVSSGYSDSSVMSDYRRHGFRAVLAKPYGIDQVEAVIQEAMTDPGPEG